MTPVRSYRAEQIVGDDGEFQDELVCIEFAGGKRQCEIFSVNSSLL